MRLDEANQATKYKLAPQDLKPWLTPQYI